MLDQRKRGSLCRAQISRSFFCRTNKIQEKNTAQADRTARMIKEVATGRTSAEAANLPCPFSELAITPNFAVSTYRSFYRTFLRGFISLSRQAEFITIAYFDSADSRYFVVVQQILYTKGYSVFNI
jgi:hypothetical protein